MARRSPSAAQPLRPGAPRTLRPGRRRRALPAARHGPAPTSNVSAPVLVGTQQYLGVRVAREAVAVANQRGAQFAEVVDLAVEDECDAGRPIAHGLAGSVGIDDRQPPVAERHLLPVSPGLKVIGTL